MAEAVLSMSGIIGLGLVIPIAGSLRPKTAMGEGVWAPLESAEWHQLQAATTQPVKLNFSFRYKDAYLPEANQDHFVWGVRSNEDSMRRARPDIFAAGPRALVPYPVVTMGFAIFSPICPHLGCAVKWVADTSRFVCPCHGSEYSLQGAHLAGPAPRGLDPLPLRERRGRAEVTWIRYDKSRVARIVISYSA